MRFQNSYKAMWKQNCLLIDDTTLLLVFVGWVSILMINHMRLLLTWAPGFNGLNSNINLLPCVTGQVYYYWSYGCGILSNMINNTCFTMVWGIIMLMTRKNIFTGILCINSPVVQLNNILPFCPFLIHNRYAGYFYVSSILCYCTSRN